MTPETPACRADEFASAPLPRGLIKPKPVTATVVLVKDTLRVVLLGRFLVLSSAAERIRTSLCSGKATNSLAL